VTRLRDKTKKALDEGRILVLGVQVLIGFQFRSVFQPGFERLGIPMQHLRLGGLVLMLLALQIMPATYHRIADRGEDSADLLDVTTGMIELALPSS
jgi:small neutral amino acid transporter SnatA (MarC family)